MDDNWGPAEPIRQAVHDLVHKFTSALGAATPSPQSDHDKAVQQMTQQNNADAVQRANQSFIKPAAAADIRKKAMGK